jgi:hypothetical protein
MQPQGVPDAASETDATLRTTGGGQHDLTKNATINVVHRLEEPRRRKEVANGRRSHTVGTDYRDESSPPH